MPDSLPVHEPLSQGCAIGQGMAFNLPGLNRVSDLVRVCPNYKQGITRLHIQVRVNSQTKGLERGWKRGARLERDAKKPLTRAYEILKLRYADFEKKKPTVLQLLAPHAGIFRGARIPSLPTNDEIRFYDFFLQNIACEQALLFGQAKRASRERASELCKTGSGFQTLSLYPNVGRVPPAPPPAPAHSGLTDNWQTV